MIYWPLLIHFAVAVALVAGMLLLSHVLGERHAERATGEPYEAGIVPTGTGRARFSVRFYLVAILFVVFDLEVVYLFAWAVAARELGWSGYFEALFFSGVLLAALLYLWRVGALDWVARGPVGSGQGVRPRGRERPPGVRKVHSP